jgi:hypothetical protein
MNLFFHIVCAAKNWNWGFSAAITFCAFAMFFSVAPRAQIVKPLATVNLPKCKKRRDLGQNDFIFLRRSGD